MTLALTLALVVVTVVAWPPPRRPRDAVTEPRLPATDEETPGQSRGADAAGPVTVEDAADALVLTALALRAGLAPVEALEAVAAEVPAAVGQQLRVVASAHRWGQDAATAWAHVGDAWRPAAVAWQAAERSGAAPAGVVLAAAQRMRRQESARVEVAVQRAGVLLVLPLGLCFLPGFAATTVVPVVLHLARTALIGG